MMHHHTTKSPHGAACRLLLLRLATAAPLLRRLLPHLPAAASPSPPCDASLPAAHMPLLRNRCLTSLPALPKLSSTPVSPRARHVPSTGWLAVELKLEKLVLRISVAAVRAREVSVGGIVITFRQEVRKHTAETAQHSTRHRAAAAA